MTCQLAKNLKGHGMTCLLFKFGIVKAPVHAGPEI